MARKIKRQQYDLNHPFSARDANKSKYSRRAAESLVLWLQMTPEEPTNGANNSLTAEYEGAPAISFESISSDPQRRHVATFSDSGNSNIKVASNIALSHSALAHAGTPQAGSDLPFSVSTWVKFDDIETGEPHYIFGKDDGTTWEYYLYHSTVQRFVISLRDTANSKNQFAQSTSQVTPSDFNEKWNHIVVTYDGRGGDSAYLGIKMYINGSEHALSDAGSESGYVGMRPNTGTGTGELYVGAAYAAGSSELDGSMSEFAMWKGHALSQTEVAAIYSITQYGKREVSGIINNPPRTLLRSADRIEGAYPAALGECRSDFMGKGLHPFNDLNSPSFVGNFSTAEIEFVPHPNSPNGEHIVFENLTFIGLTGSKEEGLYRNFTFVNGAYADDIKVVTYSNDARVHLSGAVRPPHVARQFAKQVNKENIGINAVAINNKVKLTMQLPNTGTYRQHGNIIVTGNINNLVMTPERPIKVSQFADISAVNTKYPYALSSDYFSLLNAAATPFTTASIETFGVSRSGNNTVVYTPKFSNESIKPFVDGEPHININSPFFAIGTPQEVLPGFSSPLKSKSSITFNLVSKRQDVEDDGLGTHIFYATSSLVDGTDVTHKSTVGKSGSGMAYWNIVNSRWEMLEPELLDNHSNNAQDRARSCLGFSPSAGHVFTSPSITSTNRTNFLDLASTVGNPVSEFGFPIAKQYNATGSQCYNMSDYITSPFLLEKIVLEIEGEFGLTGMEVGDSDQPFFKQFFILSQFTDPDKPHITGSFQTQHIKQGSAADAVTGGTAQPVQFDIFGHRELIGYAKIGFIRNDHEATPLLGSNALKIGDDTRDLADALITLPESNFSTAGSPGVSGSYVIEFEPSVASFSQGTSLVPIRRVGGNDQPEADNYVLLTNKGGATCTGELSGRQLASSFSNFPVVKNLNKDESGTATLNRQIRHRIRQHSPYLIMPEDKIVFGWQNRSMQTAPDGEMTNISNNVNLRTDRSIATDLIDRIQRAKVTFFGSHVLDGKEKHRSFNQLLTTNEVYETIGNDPVLDKFDVSDLIMLSGSVSDAVMTGKMADNDRRRVCSIASGQAGLTGSLSRNIEHFHGYGFFKDSLPISLFGSLIKDITSFDDNDQSGADNNPSDKFIPIIDPAIAQQAVDESLISSTVDVDGVSVPLSTAIKNFLAMFPDASKGPYLELAEFHTGLDIIDGGGVTDPPEDHQTNDKFINFPKNNSYGSIHSDPMKKNEEGVFMQDAISSDPTSFGSNSPAGSNKDVSKHLSSFAQGTFNGQNSAGPGAPGTGLATTGNPSIKEILGDGTINLVSGSLYNKLGLLPGLEVPETPFGFFDDAYFQFIMTTCWPIKLLGVNLGVFQNGFFVPAGMKYGYGWATPTPPSYHFSRRHFGHYADMIATPGETAMSLNGDAIEGPVRVKFFSRAGEPDVDPTTTNTQNLSVFCTSSVPYDEGPGAVRDRTTLQPDLDDDYSISQDLSLILDE